MPIRRVAALLATVGAVGAGDLAADPDDRLYGRVRTTDGRVVEGYLRWDRNEATWADAIDGLKEIPAEWEREAESLDPEYAAQKRRERSLVAFGVRLTWDVDDGAGDLVSLTSIRLGHVRQLVPIDARSGRLTLSSGEEVVLRSSSTDLGRGMQALEIESEDGVVHEVEWREIDRVDFSEPPPGRAPPTTSRLYGIVETWSDLTLTGYVSWDRDESLDTDVLDGRADGEDYEIPFADIAGIEWASDRSARVLLESGEELELRGTNDVDRDNRGIEISDPGLGRAIVRWEDFKSVTFLAPDGPLPRPTYAPGDPLWGTVYAMDGRVIEGEVRWDNDESQAWEPLDGWYGDVDLDIEFGSIAEIDRVDADRVVVTLVDGRRLELEDSSDVDERNRGVFVKPEGRARRLVRWEDLDRVVFGR